MRMILTVAVKLNPTPDQAEALKETLVTCNKACNWISKVAWREKAFQLFRLSGLAYGPCRERFSLPAQMVVRSIGKVASAYKTQKAAPPGFKKLGSMPFDGKQLRFLDDSRISISTIAGRIKVPVSCGELQRPLLKSARKQANLAYRGGSFFLYFACEVEAGAEIEPTNALGVDLGIVNLATDSRGKNYEGDRVDDTQRKFNHRRRNLQKKRTRSAKRKLKKISGKQKRFQRDVNHCISKAIVADAKRYRSTIALEDLKGIRKGVKARKRQRARLHNWGFYQLQKFIEYKAELEGIPVVYVDPKNTSRHCPECGHLEKKNRKTRDTFKCVGCGHEAPADLVAARNIRARAVANQPMVADAA